MFTAYFVTNRSHIKIKSSTRHQLNTKIKLHLITKIVCVGMLDASDLVLLQNHEQL